MQDKSAEESKAPLVEWFSTPQGLILAAVLVAAVSAVLLLGNLSKVGIWEPWEATEIEVGQQYWQRDQGPEVQEADLEQADSAQSEASAAAQSEGETGYNWAVPTHDGKPVARPLLKTWLMAWSLKTMGPGEEPEIGTLEFAARAPLGGAAFLLVMLTFVWVRRFYGTWAAMISGVALATVPAMYLGANLVSSEMLFMVTTSAAIMAFAQWMYAPSRKLLWGALFGLALGLAFLDQRLLGLYLPLAVIIGFAVTQLPYLQARQARGKDPDATRYIGPSEIGLCAGSLIAAASVVIWGVMRSSDSASSALFLPHVFQWVSILAPAFVLLAGFFLARKTAAIKHLVSVPGALALGITALIVVPVLVAYGDANPVLLQDGQVLGKIPVLTYLLENHLFHPSLATEHKHFAMWIRQLGFAMLPWVALVPLALGYLAQATRLEDEDEQPIDAILDPAVAVKRLLLVWVFIAFVIVAVAAVHGHYFFPAYVPLMVGVGLMMTDAAFWKRLRLRPMLLHSMGFTALAIIMMLGKDLERFPDRLIELYVILQPEISLPETFGYGSALKGLKYASMLLLGVYFFGLISWGILMLRGVREWPARTKAVWQRWRNRRASPGADGSTSAEEVKALDAAMNQRARAKEDFRDSAGLLPALARTFERPQTYSLILVAAFAFFAINVAYGFVPQLSHHLSQRGVFETYVKHAGSGEPLLRYQVPVRSTSVYLDGVETIANTQAFVARFTEEERFFAVIPRDRLAAANTDVRRAHKQNLTVLDARSSQLLLVSNQLAEGEVDQNFVAAAIVEDEAEIQNPVHYGSDDEPDYARLDNQLEFLGYSLDRAVNSDGIATYKWGEQMTLTTYFRVLRRVPGQQRIFLHIDFPGNRIHGDHDPVNGEFPTNQWLPGDIIKDEYQVTIDRYSSVGVYSMNMGFFRGSQRMKVEPRKAHDGQNRITVGRIRVEAF